ncbi:methyltransferase domain-containing protein [bacterium]|nr:methyltransferase domain-containing protein [bacterium]
MIEIVAQRMAALGFVESAVEEMLELRPFTFRRSIHQPAYRRRWRPHGSLGLAVAFFLLQESLSLEDLKLLLGDQGIAAMHLQGFLEPNRLGIRSKVDLYPCMGSYFFTDSAFELDPWPEQVYWLGGDSYTLAYCTPRRAYARALDVCSGSGVHALLAGCPALGVDINPRAVHFGQLNAALNGLTEVKFVQGDACSATGCYDLVTLNPPFVPTPEGVAELYRTGGGTGEGVTERVMRRLPEWLSPGGLFSMATECPDGALERMRRWLGPGWGLAELRKFEFPIEDYIFSNILSSATPPELQEAEYERWLDSYSEYGITRMVSAQYFAVPNSGTWQSSRELPHPLGPRSSLTQAWLCALQAWNSPWPEDFVPRLKTPVFLSEDRALAQFPSEWAAQPLALDRDVVLQIQEGQPIHLIRDRQQLKYLGEQMVVSHWNE